MTDLRWDTPEKFRRQFGSLARVRWLQYHACACGCGAWPSEAAHVVSRAAGGGPDDMIPLGPLCHRAQHAEGVETFAHRRGLDLRALARAYAARWESYENG